MRRAIKRFVHGALRRPWAAAGVLLLVLTSGTVASVALRTPRHQRDWVEHLALESVVDLRAGDFTIAPVLAWRYDHRGPTRKSSTGFSAAFDDLRRVWFVLEPQPGGNYAAHTLVLFEFTGDRIVGLTVEARRETDEPYDPLLGLFNRYELAYVWSTAEELLTRRAVFLEKEVYVYSLALSADQRNDFLRAVLAETRALAARPRFYNTLTSNCTNELAKAAELGWHPSWVLTGYSPQRLFDLGLIPGPSFEAARERARLTDVLRRLNSADAGRFDSLLLAELRRRHGPWTRPPA